MLVQELKLTFHLDWLALSLEMPACSAACSVNFLSPASHCTCATLNQSTHPQATRAAGDCERAGVKAGGGWGAACVPCKFQVQIDPGTWNRAPTDAWTVTGSHWLSLAGTGTGWHTDLEQGSSIHSLTDPWSIYGPACLQFLRTLHGQKGMHPARPPYARVGRRAWPERKQRLPWNRGHCRQVPKATAKAAHTCRLQGWAWVGSRMRVPRSVQVRRAGHRVLIP